MALAALCDDSEWGRTWTAVLQTRFHSDGPLDEHSVGNLLIAGLWQRFPDPVMGLDWVGKLLGARGRVLPISTVPLTVWADVITSDGTLGRVSGQKAVALSEQRITHIYLEPPDPPACPEALAAVREADWVVLGPGSWYTSVIVHLLVPELAQALHETKAKRLLTLNLGNETETDGLSPVDHLAVLLEHAPDLRIDAVLADPSVCEDVSELEAGAKMLGAELIVSEVATNDGSATHDTLRLAAAYKDIIGP
jgi:uncharacterized cofD-like protein